MNTEGFIHMPECFTIDLSALCNSSNSIWKTIQSHRWVKLSCENIGMCLSYVPFTLVIRLINYWDFIQIWYDNKMLSSKWDGDNQHFVYIIVSWYLLGIITRQGFLFSCSCMNRCTCSTLNENKMLLQWLCNLNSNFFNNMLLGSELLMVKIGQLSTKLGLLIWWLPSFYARCHIPLGARVHPSVTNDIDL